MPEIRTAICPVTISGGDYRRTHDACHQAALLWNLAVDWVRAEWEAVYAQSVGRRPGKYDIGTYLTSLPLDERPLHAHTTEVIAHDLCED